jgi:hypothetical protein
MPQCRSAAATLTTAAAGNPTQILLSRCFSTSYLVSQQRRLPRWWWCACCLRRQLRLRCCGCAIQMRQYPRDDRRIFDAGQHLEFSLASGAAVNLNAEHPLQALRPSHSRMAGNGGLLVALYFRQRTRGSLRSFSLPICPGSPAFCIGDVHCFSAARVRSPLCTYALIARSFPGSLLWRTAPCPTSPRFPEAQAPLKHRR